MRFISLLLSCYWACVSAHAQTLDIKAVPLEPETKSTTPAPTPNLAIENKDPKSIQIKYEVGEKEVVSLNQKKYDFSQFSFAIEGSFVTFKVTGGLLAIPGAKKVSLVTLSGDAANSTEITQRISSSKLPLTENDKLICYDVNSAVYKWLICKSLVPTGEAGVVSIKANGREVDFVGDIPVAKDNTPTTFAVDYATGTTFSFGTQIKKIVATQNHLAITPLVSTIQQSGDNPDLSVRLKSEVGRGAIVNYVRSFRDNWDVFGSLRYFSIKVLMEDDSKSLADNNQSFLNISGGGVYKYNDDVNFNVGAGYKTDMFMEPINVNQGVTIFTGTNKFILGAVNWKVYERGRLELEVPFSVLYHIPGVVGKYTSQAGTEFETGGLIGYRMPWGQLLAAATYSSRQQNFSNFTFKETHYNLLAGYKFFF